MRLSSSFRALVAAAAALLVSASSNANATVVIKLGTLAPDGSTWHVLLKEMAERWSEASGGQVKLKIYPGGVAGNEGDMIRKMRVGQLQAAALTVVGLHDIETSAQAAATPGLIDSQEEWNYVFEKITPVWDKRFEAKGFIPLMWGDTGTVFMFFDKEYKHPSEMKAVRVFAWSGDEASVRAWRLAGFQPVVISATDILPSLTTGMIDGFATIPMMAFTARWFERAPYMINAAWGHLPGSTLVTKEAWEKIPADIRPKLMAITKEYGDKVNADVLKQQADAIAQMKKNGLKLIELNAEDRKVWQQIAEKTWPVVDGGVTSHEAFAEVKKLRDEYRASKGSK